MDHKVNSFMPSKASKSIQNRRKAFKSLQRFINPVFEGGYKGLGPDIGALQSGLYAYMSVTRRLERLEYGVYAAPSKGRKTLLADH